MQTATQTERNVYSVSRLNREARALLEQGFGVLWVEGEISNLSQPSSGHWYFSLKDREAQVRCAMFRQRNAHVSFAPQAGQQVLARGRVSLYEPRGDYQLIIDHLEEAGLGALKREFERLKAKLAAAGLFAVERKRALPRFPRRIGVITSPTGAALRDILHILRRRFACADVLIYPAPVQGAAAVPALVAALELASARGECDVLILARGGGSIEDLWAFNDERLAHAIHASAIPVVTGIGHEIDFTIADFVADARAPTPSGAAELVTPDRNAWLAAIARTTDRLGSALRRELARASTRSSHAMTRLKLAHPGVRVQQRMQRLDELDLRLMAAMRARLQHLAHAVFEALSQLLLHSPADRVNALQLRNELLASRLRHAVQEYIARASQRWNIATTALHSVSPLATLERGFAIVTRAADGAVLREAAAVAVGETIEAHLARGSLKANVIGHLAEKE